MEFFVLSLLHIAYILRYFNVSSPQPADIPLSINRVACPGPETKKKIVARNVDNLAMMDGGTFDAVVPILVASALEPYQNRPVVRCKILSATPAAYSAVSIRVTPSFP